MKQKQSLGIIIIIAMLIVTLGVVVAMMLSGQKEIYYGYMKDSTTAEKVISESDKTVKENVKIPTDNNFQPKKGDFVKLIAKKDDPDHFVKKQIVSHDDVPHGLMMKIHDMHNMDMHHH
ncbi:hypothetical protein RN70_02575 [Staphylococcus schleiferi]|uniref:DUF4889 domain-containing protein n=1 Tax=Staphylococcus coagulans TaxID=74706 RepID=A0A9X1J616_9STAP|nr:MULTISPECIES: DUF4889 domain-containing protein [Staphylococcus]AKS66366.1 hypothetical protein LH95_02290 [Staphylococcus schleiferi]AKS68484.1 hypothetical protein NP71_02380 [Staphylococcus schleiferi]AKS70713.1 hypothetical protein OA96_02265 [Staphylococcus schleiferi]AKS72881.1 hypothetical protein RN70_02575 [Staphylococcus schleiferi]MBA8760193.1 DUF4889 domain-containing protein [Staphylococcus coagulans]